MAPLILENASDAVHHCNARPYDSRQIANHFIRLAGNDYGRNLSITQLIKLVYMAHGWTLALHDRPLINDQVEAWGHGPVVPTVYYAFRPQGTRNLRTVPIFEDPIEPEIGALLDHVYKMYCHLTPIQLSRLKHIKDDPWYKSYRGDNQYSPISDDMIAAHYRDKWQRALKSDREQSATASD